MDEAERKKRLLKRQMSGKTVKKDVESIVDKRVKFDPQKNILMRPKDKNKKNLTQKLIILFFN